MLFPGFGKHSSAIQCVIDYLAHRRRFGIHVHTVTSFEMSDNTFGCDLKRDAVELGIASRLNMIDSK